MRTSLYRGSCGNFPALGRPCLTRRPRQRPRLTWRPRITGPWRRPQRRGLWRRGPQRRPQRRQQLPRRSLAKLQIGPQELPWARRPPARRPQWPGPRGRRLQAAPPRQPNVPTWVFGNLGSSSFLPLFFSVGLQSLITLFAQVISLRCGHHDGHNYFCRRHCCSRCGCRGDSKAGS
jgi:hypothetical protein